jgi:hypothetical protein
MKHSGLLMTLGLCLFAVLWAAGVGSAVICLTLAIAAGAGFAAWARGQWQALPGLNLVVSALEMCAWRWIHGSQGLGAIPPWGAVGLVLLALLMLSPMYFLPVNVVLPRPSGRYGIGFTDLQIQDPSRQDPFEPGLQRQVWARLWYPVDPAASAGVEPRTAYFTADEARLWAKNIVLGTFKPPGFLFSHMKRWQAGACYWQLPPAAATGLPLVFFNHAALSYPVQNTALMHELASHGYVVVSLAHPHESCAVRLADGRVVGVHKKWRDDLAAPANFKDMPDYALAQTPAEAIGRLDRLLNVALKDNVLVTSQRVWRDDTVAVLEAIGAGRLDGFAQQVLRCCDTSRFAAIGMSYGASVAATLANTDSRCAAAVLLDGMVWDWSLVDRNIPSPLLMFCSDPAIMARHMRMLTKRKNLKLRFQMNDPFFEKFEDAGRRKDLYRVSIDGADHLGFTDWCLFLRAPLRGLAGLGTIDGQRMIRIVNELTLAFLRQHFLKAGTGGLEQLLQQTAEVRRFDAGYLRRMDTFEGAS